MIMFDASKSWVKTKANVWAMTRVGAPTWTYASTWSHAKTYAEARDVVVIVRKSSAKFWARARTWI